jgi:tRNA threonylcarbamoyl adenosine modification protein YjeE
MDFFIPPRVCIGLKTRVISTGDMVINNAMPVFIQSLCGQDTDVPSPTFTLVQIYDSPKSPIWHFDLYRLAHEEEVLNIGWDDALTADNICLIEWPQKAGFYLPKVAKNITIDILEETRRRIWINEP